MFLCDPMCVKISKHYSPHGSYTSFNETVKFAYVQINGSPVRLSFLISVEVVHRGEPMQGLMSSDKAYFH